MIEQTVLEQQRAMRWHRRHQERMTPRRLLRESDQVLTWLEECLVENLRFVPGWVMPRLVTLLSQADPCLPREPASRRPPSRTDPVRDSQSLRLGRRGRRGTRLRGGIVVHHSNVT